MASILVTGAAGFIGSHLCEKLLLRNDQVIGIDNFDPFYDRSLKEQNLSLLLSHPSFQFYELNLCAPNSLLKALAHHKIDVVVHTAAKTGILQSQRHPHDTILNNIFGTLAVLDWMRASGCHNIIFTSSSSVYGRDAIAPFEEDHQSTVPLSVYASTKQICESLFHAYHRDYGFNSIVLRLFNVYGPRQRPDLAIHKFCRLIFEGSRIQIFGAGDSSRDYTHVDDVIQGIVASVDYLGDHQQSDLIINIGNNTPHKMLDVLHLLASHLQRPLTIVYEPEHPSEMKHTHADIRKAHALLGYSPKVDFETGVKQFVEWFIQKQKKASYDD
ncbi:MAG: NAD-dependent epimerase/dehydratase family protein [bacterium]